MKKIPNFRLFSIYSLSFLVGILTASFINLDFKKSSLIFALTILALFFSALVNFSYKNYLLVVSSFAFIFFSLGLAYYSHFEYEHTPSLIYGEEMEIEGKIIEKPEVDIINQKLVVKITNANKPCCINGRILLSLPRYPNYHYGDNLNFIGKVEKPQQFEDFDYERFLKKQLIFGIVSQSRDVKSIPNKLMPIEKVYKNLYAVSDTFEYSLNRILPEPHASLASGLVLGIKRNIPENLNDALTKTGLTHIIALSGYNVTIIISVISTLLLGYLSRKQIFFIGLLLVAGFVVLTGAASSVVRAAIFSLLIIFGKTIGRQGDFTNLMLLAALVMVLFNPFVLRSDVGFQLSFLAFSGLVYLSPITLKIFERKRFLNVIPEIFKLPLIETLSAQIAVMPLILSTFGRVSIIGPIANVLVVWIVGLSMAVSFIAGLLGIIYYPLGKIAANLAWPCLEFIIKSVEWLSKIPLASIELKSKSAYLSIILFMIIITFVLKSIKKYQIKF